MLKITINNLLDKNIGMEKIKSKMTAKYFGCPKCRQIWAYSGYPNDPQLSLVECLHCGYVGVGAEFKRHTKPMELKK